MDHLGYILKGLEVLTQTYSDDPRAVAKIETTKKLVQTGMLEHVIVKNQTMSVSESESLPNIGALAGGASSSTAALDTRLSSTSTEANEGVES